MRLLRCTSKYTSVKRAREYFSNFFVAGAKIQEHFMLFNFFYERGGDTQVNTALYSKKNAMENYNGKGEAGFCASIRDSRE